MADEFDAPRRMPSENSEKLPDLEELQRQTCQLFEEFLLLEDSFCSILDEPSSATYYGDKEVADSPIEKFYKPKTAARTRGILLFMLTLRFFFFHYTNFNFNKSSLIVSVFLTLFLI